MFNASKNYEVKIISGGIKSCLLKFPTDAQWIERARSQKTVRNFLGRGKSTTTVLPSDEADRKLFRALAVNEQTEEITAADAGAFIERLERAEVTSAEWEGDTRRIEMKVPGAVVTHVLRIPTQAQMRPHERSSAQSVYSNRSAEIRVNIQPSADLWDKIKISVDGYEGPVPINHKVAAVSDLIEALPSLIEDLEEASPKEQARPEDQEPTSGSGQTSRASAS